MSPLNHHLVGKIGSDKPFCFPCVWRCLRPVVLLLCVSCLRLSVLMHGPGLAAASGAMAAAPCSCAAGSLQAASRRVPGWWRVDGHMHGSAGQAYVRPVHALVCIGRPGRPSGWLVPILNSSPFGRGQHPSRRRMQGSQGSNGKARPRQDLRGCGCPLRRSCL